MRHASWQLTPTVTMKRLQILSFYLFKVFSWQISSPHRPCSQFFLFDLDFIIYKRKPNPKSEERDNKQHVGTY